MAKFPLKGAKADKSPPEPKTFGRYRVLSPLGQGAMASVYLAEDPVLGRMVAIKVIHGHLAAQADLLTRFTAEAKTAAALRSPNIVEVFDYGLEGGSQYLVMEYIDGPTLQQVLNLQMGEPLTPRLAACLAVQAAEGLMVAERRKVVHRDIKPENLMLTGTGLLKIADFGIAHISEQNLTRTGSILGSPNYMAPEQIDGGKPTPQTDMFALGAVFYFMLTGRKPFAGANIPMIFRAICETPHRPVLEANPDCDPQLAEMAETLLHKNPEERGEGAKALALRLKQWLNQQEVFDASQEVHELLSRLQPQGESTLLENGPPQGAASVPVTKPPEVSAVVPEPASESAPPKTTAAKSAMAEKMASSEAGSAGKPLETGRVGASLLKARAMLVVGIVAGALVLVGIVIGIANIPTAGPAVSAAKPKVEKTPLVLPETSAVALPSSGLAAADSDTAAARSEMDSTHEETADTTQAQAEVQRETTELSVITSPPFAEVFLDGRFFGTTPFKAKTVTTARYRLFISHRRFASIDTVIRLKPGKQSLRFRFSDEKAIKN